MYKLYNICIFDLGKMKKCKFSSWPNEEKSGLMKARSLIFKRYLKIMKLIHHEARSILF